METTLIHGHPVPLNTFDVRTGKPGREGLPILRSWQQVIRDITDPQEAVERFAMSTDKNGPYAPVTISRRLRWDFIFLPEGTLTEVWLPKEINSREFDPSGLPFPDHRFRGYCILPKPVLGFLVLGSMDHGYTGLNPSNCVFKFSIPR